ncbi:MAG: VOC family protein [Chloroflexota bacterium]
MPKPILNLLVLRTANLDASLVFYKCLGLEFVEEQHGTGSFHYACEIGGTVIEMFPGKPGTAPDRRTAGATVLGFQVTNIDELVETLQNSGSIVLTSAQESSYGRRAVVQDPDGRAIELNQLA